MTKRHLLIISALWFVIIGGLILVKQVTLWTGTTVLLQTIPVDPYDLFRGEYVTLRYPISDPRSIPDFSFRQTDKWTPELSSYQWQPGQTVYVVLQQQSDGTAIATYKTPDRPSGNLLYIKGKITGYESSMIEYGIESYFVPQGKGREIERTRGNGLLVQVTIDRWGSAVIRDIQMSDQPAPTSFPSIPTRIPPPNGNLERICLNNGGKWIEQYQECEQVNQATCSAMGGLYNECSSGCRHSNDPNALCTHVCVPLCTISPSEPPPQRVR